MLGKFVQLFYRSPNEVCAYNDFVCEEGDSAVLECRLSGSPAPIIKWYRWDNTLIQDSPDYIYLKETNETYKLIIRVNSNDKTLFFYNSNKQF